MLAALSDLAWPSSDFCWFFDVEVKTEESSTDLSGHFGYKAHGPDMATALAGSFLGPWASSWKPEWGNACMVLNPLKIYVLGFSRLSVLFIQAQKCSVA